MHREVFFEWFEVNRGRQFYVENRVASRPKQICWYLRARSTRCHVPPSMAILPLVVLCNACCCCAVETRFLRVFRWVSPAATGVPSRVDQFVRDLNIPTCASGSRSAFSESRAAGAASDLRHIRALKLCTCICCSAIRTQFFCIFRWVSQAAIGVSSRVN